MTDEEVVGLLAWEGLPGVGPRTLAGLLDAAAGLGLGLHELWDVPPEELPPRLKLPARARQAWRDERAPRMALAREEAERLRQWGVTVLPATSCERNPEIGPADYCYGALELLRAPAVAILNSRTAGAADVARTDALADALARRDVPLATSTHRPGYQAAAVAAKRHAAPVILVLDRGFAAAFPQGPEREPVPAARIWDTAFDPEHQLLLSPFGWRERWNQRTGRLRDHVVAALASTLVIGRIRAEGNMEMVCLEAASRGKPLLLLDPDEAPPALRDLPGGGCTLLPWRGAEQAAESVLATLPMDRTEAPGSRRRRAWQEEIERFAQAAAPRLAGRPSQVARVHHLQKRRPEDLGRLLGNLAEGERLTCLCPAVWLEGSALEDARRAWFDVAPPEWIVGLPAFAGDPEMERQALLFLRRGARPAGRSRVLLPSEERAGLFHLRRYLREALHRIAAERDLGPGENER